MRKHRNHRNFTLSPSRGEIGVEKLASVAKLRSSRKDKDPKMPFDNPRLKDHSYITQHAGKIHDLDREKAQSIVLNLVYDPANPDLVNNPIFNRKKEVEPRRNYDRQSLFLCG